MHASALLLFAAATGFTVAQTTSAASSTASTGAESGCGSQIDTIIAACLSSTMPQFNACPTNDWGCMCTQITNVLTCYNNCPSDPNRNSVLQQQTSYCGAASAYPSTSTHHATMTSVASNAINAAASTTSTGGTPMGTYATGSGTTAAAASATHTGAAVANFAYPGLAAALLGLAALF